MPRKCRFQPLNRRPLLLVLAQVRYNPLGEFESFLPGIQEALRRLGYPLVRQGQIQQVTVSTAGFEFRTRPQWDFRSRDERWSVVLLDDCLFLQTTAYERFEAFAERLQGLLDVVFGVTENDKFGVVLRVGLRYVNLVRPREGEDHRPYLREGFQGIADAGFSHGCRSQVVESTGTTAVGDTKGTLVVRVLYNDQGPSLPPDLLASAPKGVPEVAEGSNVAIIDLDHYAEGQLDPDASKVIERAYALHDDIIETFYGHVVTPHALEAWK